MQITASFKWKLAAEEVHLSIRLRIVFNTELTEPMSVNSPQGISFTTAARQGRAKKYVDENMLSR